MYLIKFVKRFKNKYLHIFKKKFKCRMEKNIKIAPKFMKENRKLCKII